MRTKHHPSAMEHNISLTTKVACALLAFTIGFAVASCASTDQKQTGQSTLNAVTAMQASAPATTPTQATSPDRAAMASPAATSTASPAPLSATPAVATSATPTAGTMQTDRYELMCPSQVEQARQAYNEGNTLEVQGKLEQAKAAYTSAIQLDANYCDAMDHLARLLRNEGKPEEAVALYKRSISVSPNNVVARTNLALVYLLQRKLDEAIVEYEQVVRIAPDNPEGHFGPGSAYLGMNNPEQAITLLRTAEELYAARSSPLIVDTRYYLGVAFFTSRQFAKARDYFQMISTQMGDNPSSNYYLGLSYLSQEIRDTDLAKKHLRRAQQLGIKIPTEIEKLLADEWAAPTRGQSLTPPQATPPAVPLPLPTGQPVASWNDIPIMPQAISGSEERDTYSYTVRATVQQVRDYYDKEMPKSGWQPVGQATGATRTQIVLYQKGRITASVFIVEQGELVLVMLTQR